MNRFTVNGETYTAKPFTFGLFRQLEDRGVNMAKIDTQSFTLVSAYLSICAGIDLEDADDLIEKHISNGGSFDDILVPLSKEMEDSDFFRALSRNKREGAEKVLTENTEENHKRGRKPKEA